jgi:hypothetical protein
MVIAGAVIAVALALVGGVLAVVMTPPRAEPPTVPTAAPRPAPTPPRPLRVSDLAAPRTGSHVLDVAPPTQGYGAVDPVAQIPWALAIAQGWAEDARLERVDVGRLRPDGTTNVADDPQGSLGYRFLSPARIADLRSRARTSSVAEAVTELQIHVAKGQPRVVFLPTRAGAMRPRPAAPPHPTVLPATALVSRLQRDARYTAPYLSGYLVHLEDEGWVWYLSPLGSDSVPRIRARDARPWPYRRGR